MTGPLTISWKDEDGGDEFTTIIGGVPPENIVAGETDIVVHPDGSFEKTKPPEPPVQSPEP